jgi:hypothetical protein
MNGKPGDHPLTDILHYKLQVYGEETDSLIRRVAALCSSNELYTWWDQEIGWGGDAARARQKSRARYDELLLRAQESGWELPES